MKSVRTTTWETDALRYLHHIECYLLHVQSEFNQAAQNVSIGMKIRAQHHYTENMLPCQNASEISTLNIILLETKGCFHYYHYSGNGPCFQYDKLQW